MKVTLLGVQIVLGIGFAAYGAWLRKHTGILATFTSYFCLIFGGILALTAVFIAVSA